MRAKLATLALAVLTAVAISCAAPRGTIKDAEEAQRRGDHDRAHAVYSSILASGDADPLTLQKAGLARDRARNGHVDLAVGHMAKADFAAARAELAHADRISPGDPVVESATERLEARQAWYEAAVTKVRGLLDGGRGKEAATLTEEIRHAFPAADIDELESRVGAATEQERSRKEAAERRRIVDGVLGEAETAWSRGQAGAAVEALERGRAKVGDAPELLGGRAATIRSGAASTLAGRARAELSAGRAATALLFARAALRADPSDGTARDIEGRAAGRMEEDLLFRVRLGTFRDETRGRADPVTFARRVLARADIPFTRIATRIEDPTHEVGGSIVSLDVTTSRPRVETQTHTYVAGSDWQINPEYAERRERVDDLRDEYEDAQSIWRALNDERDELERLRGTGVTNRGRRRYYGPYEEARFQRLLADSRTRETTARRERDRAARDLDRAEKRLEGVPYYLENKVTARASYTVRMQTIKARAAGWVEVKTVSPGPTGTRSSVSAEVPISDRGADAVPEAGLPFDPITLPSDAEMSERVLEKLAGEVAEQVAIALSRSRLELVSEARRLEAAGKREEALDRHAAFLLATEGRLPLERASSARRIRDAFGIDLTGESMDLSRLRTE